MDKQKRINTDICYELDKYQVILEYGRLLLDEDTRVRRKLKWLDFPANQLYFSFVADIIAGLFSFSQSIEWLKRISIVLFVLIIGIFLLRFIFRKQLSKLLRKEERANIESDLSKVGEYISFLGIWLGRLDSHNNSDKKVVNLIEWDLDKERKNIEKITNDLSYLYGPIDYRIEKEARRIAELRLEQYKRFIYE